MKKILFAALMISMLGVTYAQNTLVYNYQASIKRLNANYFMGTVTSNNVTSQTIAERYSVVSDTIQGYLVVPVCYACQTGGVNDFNTNNYFGLGANVAYIYVTRVGDTMNRRLNRNFVFKTTAYYQAGVFGAYTALNTNPASNAPLQSAANINQAWMKLDITRLPTMLEIGNVASTELLPNVSAYPGGLTYGFYGFDNTQAGVLNNAGFGSVMNTTHIDRASVAWCGSNPQSITSCQIIQSISGSTIGNPQYLGPCSATPMWDLCYRPAVDATDLGNPLSETNGAVCGTWVLVYDAALSNETDANKENAILQRMGATGKMLDLTRTTTNAQ